MKEQIRWADNPNRHERRRRMKMIRTILEFKPTRGAFGASPIDTKNAIKRRQWEYYKKESREREQYALDNTLREIG